MSTDLNEYKACEYFHVPISSMTFQCSPSFTFTFLHTQLNLLGVHQSLPFLAQWLENTL